MGSDVEAVLVVGGDGTVCEVVNGLMERPLPIVILSSGTENLLAREFRMPTGPEDVARTLLYGESFPCDVGVITTTSHQATRRFLAVTGVGFDAECVARMTRMRRGHITRSDYFWPIWQTFWSHRFPILRVEFDGGVVFEGCGLVIAGVIGRYSVGMRVLPHARYDDGLLDVCIFPCGSRWTLLGHAYRIFTKGHVGRGGVIYHQTRSLRIRSPQEVPIEIDGDVGGALPADVSIIPRAAMFRRPQLRLP
jgi:diacylglycerol kinase family enzyme